MPIHSTELSSCARYAELPVLMAFLARQAEQTGSSAADILRFQLVLEELFSNTIDHGYGGECDQLICISVQPRPDGLTLVYRDQAPAFDPTVTSSSAQAEGFVGGLGIKLVLGLTQGIRYYRVADGNRIELEL